MAPLGVLLMMMGGAYYANMLASLAARHFSFPAAPPFRRRASSARPTGFAHAYQGTAPRSDQRNARL